MKIELSRSSKDIILACKGYYSTSESETILEKFQRVIGDINGKSPSNVTIHTINWWLSEVYSELLEIKEARISKNELMKFVRGVSMYQDGLIGYEDLGSSFWFLRDSIGACRCKDVNCEYELVLDINDELDTDYAKQKRIEVEESNRRALKGGTL